MNKDNSDVSVVVCTRNNKGSIRSVIESIKRESPGELIVVDGGSTDGTQEILGKLGVKVLYDPGKGLALARQIALNEVNLEYTLFVGDDNILRRGSIQKIKQYMINHDWIGAAFQTRIKEARKSYWAFCANLRWKVRFYEGERSVIGTPHIFRTNLLKATGYDERCTVSDDSDMERRLAKITDKKFGYSDVICYEIGKTGYKETITRFLIYGKSDAQFWKKYSPGWGGKRKWKSICHPLEDELIKPLKRIESIKTKIQVLPYFVLVTIIRYIGWIKENKNI